MSTTSELSKIVSHALRHEPRKYELELDDAGWVAIEQLVEGIRGLGGQWMGVDSEVLSSMVECAPKRRHEIVQGRIRALYGHSASNGVTKVPSDPPALLFHGTSPAFLSQVYQEGLLPGKRQFVHLSIDQGTALAVASLRSHAPVVLAIDAERAVREGAEFFEGSEAVWLAERVPPLAVTLANPALR